MILQFSLAVLFGFLDNFLPLSVLAPLKEKACICIMPNTNSDLKVNGCSCQFAF